MMFSSIADWMETTVTMVVAYGAAGGGGLSFLSSVMAPLVVRLVPAVPPALVPVTTTVVRWLLVLLTVGCTWASSWSFSAIKHDREDEIARLKAVAAEQARQREAYERIATHAQERAMDREAESRSLQEKVDEYEKSLETGEAKRCADDPAYRSRMRSIRIPPSQSASPGD